MSVASSTRPAARSGPQKAKRPGWDVPLRILLAAVGGYTLTSLCTVLLARILPGSPVDASLGATLMSFAIATGLVVWVFAARNALKLTAWMLGLIAVTGALAWAALPGGGTP